VTIQIKQCQVLRLAELPAREPYPPTHLVSLFQESTGELVNCVCSDECFPTLQAIERTALVTIEASARQFDLASVGATRGGKAYRLRVTAVFPEDEG